MKASKSKRTLKRGRRARVLVIDDSSTIQKLVSAAISTDPLLEVVGRASNGREAIEQALALRPDVITLDIDMPEMDGLATLQKIREVAPELRVIMLSSLTEQGAEITFEALTLGADDYLLKTPVHERGASAMARLSEQLLPKLRQFFDFEGIATSGCSEREVPRIKAFEVRDSPAASVAPRVLALGVSTGGPAALAAVVPQIPADFELPILIVQHMPPVFTKLLCERLQERSQLMIREAVHGEVLPSGSILIAPGDYHMSVVRDAQRVIRIALDQKPPENSCRPAVDVLFRSLAGVYRNSVLGIVLTGMGQDGLLGSKALKAAGSRVFVQDEETSAVWGMPRAVAEAGLADAILPLSRILPHALRYCSAGSHVERMEFQRN